MRLVLIAGLALLLAACFEEEKTGPVEIHFDRESCEMCRMLISDPRFVAEVRGGPKMEVHKFDDIGDALHWLNKQSWKNEKTTEVWVADMNSQNKINWLDAQKAFYLADQMTPMNYGYGALAVAGESTVDFQTMKAALLGKGNNLLCETPINGANAEEHTQADHERHMRDPNHQHDPAHHHPENHK